MKHYFCFLVLSVLLLIPIDTYASSQAISLKVGETKTVSLPRDVTSKNTYAFNCSTDQSTCIDIVSFDKYSVSLRGAKEFKGTVYVYYDFFYEENGRRHSDTHTIMVDVYEQGTGGGTSGSGDDSWGTGYQDKGCWGTITVTKGSEQTVYANFPVVNEDKVKCYKWSSKGSPAFSITSKNWNKCVVKGEFTGFTGSSSRLYCYMEYGTNSFQAYYDINVTAPKVTLVSNISLNKESVSLLTEETTQLTPTISPSNATYKTVTWASDNIDVATVSSNGLVKAVGEGSATITCRATDGSGVIATCKITVKKPVPPTGIIVSPSSMNINIGDTKTLSYSLTPTDATTTVTWKSDNTSIATVGKYSGEVKGVGVGTTYIWAITANGKKDCCIVTVEEPPFIGVKYAIAGYDHSLVIKDDGSLWACGNNENGQLCNGKTSEIHSFTKIMDGVSNAAAGDGNSRIIKDDGSLWACGSNSWGQLGDGTTTTRRYLKKVMDNVAYVTGGLESLIIKKDATLWVCGINGDGQLGNGTKENITSPVKIMNDVSSVYSGNHSLIVKKDGSLWACGWNDRGQLGDGTTTNRTRPVKIMENVSTVAAGGGHSLIVKKDGTLWACGSNTVGQLGDGTTTNRGSLKKIMDNVASVEATSRYSFIIKTDGSLWACGENDQGQLGAGFASMYSTPVKIMDDVRSVSTQGFYTLIVKKDGSLWACGRNDYGQLGDGTTTNRYRPVEIMEGNSASGINDIRYEKDVFNNSSTTKIYSITGQRISYPKKGINIINGKKVLVK